MLKTVCICDRCKKQFEAKLAQRISFEYTLTPEETMKSKIIEVVAQAFPKLPRDYCPECVAEIKDFMKLNKTSKAENSDNTSQVVFSPQITIQGNASKEDIKSALQISREEFDKEAAENEPK